MKIDKFTKFREIDKVEVGAYPIPEPDEFISIRDGGTVDRVLFRCPCGCGHSVCLPVRPAGSSHPGRTSWEYRAHGKAIYPSVRDVGTCYAHFYINEDGTVEWCGDSGQRPA